MGVARAVAFLVARALAVARARARVRVRARVVVVVVVVVWCKRGWGKNVLIITF